MYKKIVSLIAIGLFLTLAACASVPRERYNTQKGALIGGGLGALTGQAIGHNPESTLIGAGVGALLGSIIGNAVDQDYEIAREAAATNKRVVYYDDRGGAVEAIPGPKNQSTQCRKVTKRVWDRGELISEKIEEVCEGEKNTDTY